MTQIIISGCPRSGTTALKSLLNTQHNTCVTNELKFCAGNNDAFAERLNSSWFKKFSNECKKKNIDPELFRDHIIEDKIKTSKYLHSLGYQIVGDKFPGYVLPNYHKKIIELSRKGFKYIFCIRDCRGFISSSIRAYERGVNPKGNVWVYCTIHEACEHWVKYNKGLQALIQHIPSENYIIVQYEQAVRNNAKLVDRISKLTERQWSALPEETTDYHPVHVKAWETEHPDIDQHLSEDALRLMELYGYQYD